MEHGRLVVFENHFRYTPYITVKHEGYYLFLSLDNLNRLEDFTLTINDKYKDYNMNVNSLMIPDIIENHIEETDPEYKPLEDYRSGMILRNKITEELRSMIIVRDFFKEYSYYLIDLDTFELQNIKKMIGDEDSDHQLSYVKDNYYTYDFNFADLDIKVRR